MQIIATGSAKAGSSGAAFISGSAQTGDPRPWAFEATSAAGAARPIAQDGLPVLYDAALTVEGVGTAYRTLDLADWSVQETMDRGTSWSVIVAPYGSDGARRALGVEMQWIAPPPGKLPVDLSVIYLSAAGEAEYQLVKGGISDSSDRSIFPASMSIQGLGKMGHYDHKKVTVNVPARSGWTHGKIIILMAQSAGIPDANIKVSPTLGSPRLKAYDIVDEDFPVAVAEVAAACGFGVDFDRAGDLVAFELVPSGPPVATFEPHEIVADSETRVSVTGDVPTCLIFEGSGPEGQPSAAGRVHKIKEVLVYGELVLDYATYQQDASPSSTGALIALGVTTPIVKQNALKLRTTIEEIYQDGCLEQRWTTEESYYNPVAARYQIDTTGDPSTYKFCFIFEPGAVANDGSTAYQWPIAKFVPTKVVAEGFRYDTLSRLRRVDTVYALWKNLETAVKQRATPATDWESQDFINNQRTEAGGRGVVYDAEKWFEGRGFHTSYENGWDAIPLTTGLDLPVDGNRVIAWSAVDVKEITNNPLNYITAEEVATHAFGAKAGFEYLFNGGGERSEPEEKPGYEAGGQVTIYDAEEGGGLTTIVTELLAEGKTGDQTITRGDGNLPASELCDGELSDRASNTLIEVRVCAYEEVHAEYEERISNDFIESASEARAFIVREFKRRVAPRVVFPVPISAGIERAMPIAVRVPYADIDHEGWVEQADHTVSSGGQGVTIVTMVTRID